MWVGSGNGRFILPLRLESFRERRVANGLGRTTGILRVKFGVANEKKGGMGWLSETC